MRISDFGLRIERKNTEISHKAILGLRIADCKEKRFC
jgi:hypothetical protein